MSPSESPNRSLNREVGLFGAVLLGLGSIVGSGVFISIAIAAGAAGPAVVLAIALAGVVATCNGLSSASLAAAHPVSGGTYECGNRWLNPTLGFIAGWTFLCAKTASAATAALGFAGYLLEAIGRYSPTSQLVVALAAVVAITALVLAGLRRSNVVNAVVVSLTVLSLATFVVAGAPSAFAGAREHFTPFFAPVDRGAAPLAGFLEAAALMFVAYTGYGRVATLGEEIRDPRKNIPRAIVATLAASMLIYIAVGFVAVAAGGAKALSEAGAARSAPLEIIARGFASPPLGGWIGRTVALGAISAMLGVLLNLVLGVSRVVLAMARRGDLPRRWSKLSETSATPIAAILLVGLTIAGLVCLGNVRTTWSFSAFTVLIYYAITNLAALRLAPQERLVPSAVAWLGLASCVFLTFWVEPIIWAAGLALIAVGLLLRNMFRRSDERSFGRRE